MKLFYKLSLLKHSISLLFCFSFQKTPVFKSTTFFFVFLFFRKCAKEFNAVTEEPFEEALEAARAVDVKVARGDPLRPLEGLPISVKDCVEQRNCLATCGLASKADIVLKDDGLLVKLLRDAGAIPFVRGNIPQALVSFLRIF